MENQLASNNNHVRRQKVEEIEDLVQDILCSQSPPRQRSPALLVFFILLALNCLLSSLYSCSSTSGSLTKATGLLTPVSFWIQPVSASRVMSSNQRVDSPSADDFPPLTGLGFTFTSQTPLGALKDPQTYLEGALATQKLIAAPLIPIDRQQWTGIDTRTAYFANDFGANKIDGVPKLLQAGMRRLVLDLWWDSQGLGWQLCPRLKRDGTQVSKVHAALEQGELAPPPTLELKRMGANQAAPIAPELQRMGNNQATTREFLQEEENQVFETDDGAWSGGGEEEPSRLGEVPMTNFHKRHVSAESAPRKEHHDRKAQKSTPSRQTINKTGSSRVKEWFHKKKPRRKPAIKLKDPNMVQTNKSEVNGSEPQVIGLSPHDIQIPRRRARQRLAMNKGVVSTYDKSSAVDTTVDGITCSTGEDIVMLLQGLQTWIQQTVEPELEDVLLIILNLNEFNNNSLGIRPPAPPPAANTSSTTIPIMISPNTNNSIKALVPNLISLKQLFLDAFDSQIYSPTLLELDREDLESSWWRSGPVGQDYYNTTTDPMTGKVKATTGWPTSLYLRDVIKRRVVVGIGANNLNSSSTYNITDDYTTIHRSGALGPSMANSSLLHISSALTQQQCSFPQTGVMMLPTGTEENLTAIASARNSSDSITSQVSWGFSSMSDSNLLPWSYSSGRLATDCGFSLLMEGSAPVLSFLEQVAMGVWSWDLDQPPSNQTRSRDQRCGAMQSNGRWIVQDCNMKLPVACRKIGTSSAWIINDKSASNYRDVTCPTGYRFDVPRTARENQQLYDTLLGFWNASSHEFYTSLIAQRNQQQQAVLEPTFNNPFRALLDPEAPHRTTVRMKRHDSHESDGSDDDDEDDDHREDDDESNNRRQTHSGDHGSNRHPGEHGGHSLLGDPKARKSTERNGPFALGPTTASKDAPLSPIAGVPGGGLIWIDISSWQTAGCWVPGGVDGVCPYQAADNTVALQEIIKVSSIGGVIILVLAGMFLYLKCRRNVRLRKANKRRADVRMKIMRTEVETVPA
ncbi:hypothetical protein BGZ83_009932 [Gryganskiella cystojenkinii]|nr:hypothetical protein BGZ83_009932 [Gryganskiella cystojenkinii]